MTVNDGCRRSAAAWSKCALPPRLYGRGFNHSHARYDECIN